FRSVQEMSSVLLIVTNPPGWRTILPELHCCDKIDATTHRREYKMTVEQRTKLSRSEIVSALIARDGIICQYPGCDEELDFSITEGKREPTIDHIYPQSKAYEDGWTYDQVWDLSNLALMSKACNAKKGDLVYLSDGT